MKKTIIITEKQKEKIKSAMSQVHNKVNAACLDSIMVCEDNLEEENIPSEYEIGYDVPGDPNSYAHVIKESIKSMLKDGVEKKLRATVKQMVKDGSLPTDYSLEMAEWYYNIIAKALNIKRDDVYDIIRKDDRYYYSIIDDEFEKCGGKYDLMDCENHRKGMKKDLEKLHNINENKLTSTISEAIKKILLTERKNINMNVELRKGGRNAVKMTEKQFEEVLKAAWEEYFIEAKPEASYLINKWSIGNFVYKCCYNSPKRNKDSKTLGALYKDIWCTKYKFDTENVECRGGIKMSNRGVPYLVCYAGGDWECPVCFIVYYDGTKIRAYIPLKGNAINRNTHEAFGGNTEKDAPFIAKELGISEEDAKQYCSDINYDEKACVEDFLSRIEVKGEYKEKDFSKIHEEYKKLCERLEKEENNNEIVESRNINERKLKSNVLDPRRVYTVLEFERILRANGYVCVNQVGSHRKYVNPNRPDRRPIMLVVHEKNSVLKVGATRDIILNYNLVPEKIAKAVLRENIE